jgi:molybdopterin synthase catalytic subunit
LKAPGVYRKGELDLIQVLGEAVASVNPGVGAVAAFIGVARRSGLEGKEVVELEIESYPEHANQILRQICREVEEKHQVEKALVYHLTGRFQVGEPIVLALVLGGHRHQVFPALEELVHRYKTEPALWKKEVYVDGESHWVHHA